MATTKKTTVVFNSDATFPLYCMYGGQYRPQPAYIELNIRTGEIDADYSGEVGSAIPCDVWHQCRIWFYVNEELTSDNIKTIISDQKQAFDHLYSVSDVDWDGSNWRGGPSDESGLDREDWNELVNDIHHQLEIVTAEYETTIIDANSFADWCGDLPRGDAQELAAEYLSMNGDNGYYFDDSINDVDCIASLIRDMWESNIDEIGPVEAKQLIDNGFLDDNPYMDEDINEALAR